jgi:hypothetical protein
VDTPHFRIASVVRAGIVIDALNVIASYADSRTAVVIRGAGIGVGAIGIVGLVKTARFNLTIIGCAWISVVAVDRNAALTIALVTCCVVQARVAAGTQGTVMRRDQRTSASRWLAESLQTLGPNPLRSWTENLCPRCHHALVR